MIKIVTLNLNYCGEKHGSWVERKKLIKETLKNIDPDIIALQAVCTGASEKDKRNQARQLADELGNYPYVNFCPVSRQPDGRHDGNAVLSKYPVTSCEHLLLSLNQSEDTVQRLVQKTGITINNRQLYLFNSHFSWVKDQTIANVNESLDFLNGVEERALLVGDFNTDPADNVLNPLKHSGWKDLWEINRGKEDGFTFESDKPFTRIDYAWANKYLEEKSAIEIISGERDGKVRLSDHKGLLVRLDW